MSAEILKAKKQLGEIGMLLKQGKLLAAVANLHDAVGFIIKGQLLKHEIQAFTESLDRAAYALANDRELKKIYPLQISYKPGEERELLSSLHELLAFLQENLAEEANTHLAALAEYRNKQLELARKHLEADESAKAQQICNRLIDAARTDTELKITVADMFLEFGKYDEALEYLKDAYADNPESAHVFNKLVMTLRKSGRFEEAEKFYIQALERQTQDEVIYFNLGRVYLDMKSWKKAIAAADRALAINKDFAEARKMKLYAAKQMSG
jgi:tetratricopeptide (TPR) repeat protein